jgi:undecaprenyl-diphosphatase
MTGIDAALFDLINRKWASPFLDRVLPLFSSLDAWKPVILATALLLLVFGKSTGRAFLLCLAVGLLVGDVLVSSHLKRLVNRPRPREVHAGTLERSLPPVNPAILGVFAAPVVKEAKVAAGPPKSGRSFPSSHVINVFMLATAAFQFHRFAGTILAMGGLLVAWSRVYCGSHWPGDLPVSVVLGILVGWISCRIASAILKRFGWTGRGGIATLSPGTRRPPIPISTDAHSHESRAS